MKSLFTEDWRSDLPHDSDRSLNFFNWISDRSSLTEKIKLKCRGQFSVNVLCHELIPAPDYTYDALEIKPGAELLHREVTLCDNEVPLVFACSLLPGDALVGRFREIRKLGARPLGHWIFSEPVLHRQSMEFSTIQSDAELFNRLQIHNPMTGKIPGRKTVFTGADYPFIVSEFFLPDLQRRI